MQQMFNLLRKKVVVVTKGSAQRSAMRKQGDIARDQHDWPRAERLFSAHLAVAPTDQPIWIQLGHALKEQGKRGEAEEAYRRATKLAPDDAEAHLQLAHVLKQQMKRAEAARAFARALELNPAKTTFDELTSLGVVSRAGEIVSTARLKNTANIVLFEIDDLLGWLSHHRTLSGIQRVQVGIINSVLAKVLGQAATGYGFVRSRDDDGGIWQIWATDLKDILDCAAGPTFERSEMDRLLSKAEQAAVRLIPSPGQCYFVLGAFWALGGDASRYARLRRAGVVIGVLIYDLIPITHPEYCDVHLVHDFTISLGDGWSVFDFVLTISEYTASDVRRFQAEMNLRLIPVQAVLLAHVLREEAAEEAPEDETGWTPAIQSLAGRRFVLSVSTIEGRKNHVYLVTTWRLMLEEGLDPPDLVFVGRYGWRVNDFMEQMKATGFLRGRIHVLHDITDAELEMLYRHCQFTAFPSFVEGWGLPVGESLAHGRPCIASNTTSIPEVGGNLVDYIDPFNVRSGVEAFRRMSFDDAYRQRREREVQSEFKPRTWAAVTADLLAQVERLRQTRTDENIDPLLHPGELFYPGQMRFGHIPRTYPSRPLRPILATSWYAPEPFGAWMRGSSGELRFRTELDPGTSIAVYVSLRSAPWGVRQFVTAFVHDDEGELDTVPIQEPEPEEAFPPRATGKRRLFALRQGDFIMHATGKVGPNGCVRLLLKLAGEADERPVHEIRDFSVGLIGLSYACEDDRELQSEIAAVLAVRN